MAAAADGSAAVAAIAAAAASPAPASVGAASASQMGDAAMEDGADALPGRSMQVLRLLQLFGPPTARTPSCIFVYGATSAGKTHVVRAVLRQQRLPHAMVDAVECYTPRLVFEQIINELSDELPCPQNGFAGHGRCNSSGDFLLQLQAVLDQRRSTRRAARALAGQSEGTDDGEETAYVVVDRADRLRALPDSVLRILLRLGELTQRNVCVILISNIMWEKFRTDTGGSEPYQLFFPPYSKETVLAILCLDCPSGEDVAFFRQFVGLIYDVYCGVCQDLSELRHLVNLLFPQYVAPVKRGEIAKSNSGLLYRRIMPYVQKQSTQLYLRQMSSLEWEAAYANSEGGDGHGTAATKATLSVRDDLELPNDSKFLLLAAFLASHNPMSSDQRMFARRSRKSRRQGGKTPARPKEERQPQWLKGPKTFPLTRLMAIFFAIIDAKVDMTAELQVQVSSLVALGLLRRMGGANAFDEPRFKCLISREAAAKLARTVGFPLASYLFDDHA